MEKVTRELLERFICENGVEFKPTQPRMCVPIINRIYKKMLADLRFLPIKVEKDAICDGHHRYLASLLAKVTIEKVPGVIAPSVKAINWESVVFVNEDWDTAAKIDMLNKVDADYNNIPLEKILESLK